eukprot:7390483-Prymnesium_polylepis.1
MPMVSFDAGGVSPRTSQIWASRALNGDSGKFEKLNEDESEEAGIKQGSTTVTNKPSRCLQLMETMGSEGLACFTVLAVMLGSILVVTVAMTGVQWVPYLGQCLSLALCARPRRLSLNCAVALRTVAAIVYNGTAAACFVDGLVLKLTYKPLPAPLPPWVARAQVAHNNSAENLVLFAPAVLLAHVMSVPDTTINGAATVYLAARCAPRELSLTDAAGAREPWCQWHSCHIAVRRGTLACARRSVYHWIFTLAPPIPAVKTTCFMVGWGAT